MKLQEKEMLVDFQNNIRQFLDIDGLNCQLDVPNFKEWRKPDFACEILIGKLKAKLAGEVLTEQSSAGFELKLRLVQSFVQSHKNFLPFILAKYLSDERRQICKAAGVNFFDLSGNVYLKHKRLFIEREGFPNRFPEKRRGRNPFADKASLILRALLKEGDRAWGVREMAEALKLNPGFVSKMLPVLEERNYIVRRNGKFKAANPMSILADWVQAYSYRKNHELRYFCLAKSPAEIIEKLRELTVPDNFNYALGLQAGAGLAAPFAIYKEVHVFVERREDVAFFAEALRAEQVDDGANLIFVLPYYRHSVFYDKQELDGLWVASSLQLYLDLYNYPLRGREQAEHLLNGRLSLLSEGGRASGDG